MKEFTGKFCPYCGSKQNWIDWDNSYIRCADCDSFIEYLWKDEE